MKKKRTILFMIALSAVLGVFLAFFLINPLVYSNNQKLKQAVMSVKSDTVSLNETVPFTWDAVYTFAPYITKNEIEKIIGFKSNSIQETVNDGMIQLVFIKGSKVVSSICGYSEDLGYNIYFPIKEGNYYSKIDFKENPVFSVMRVDDVVKLTYIE